MRTAAGFQTPVVAAAAKGSSSPEAAVERSPWHSPVPYLFGGLAAMLGLIAFALLILACSYWKLSGQLSERDQSGQRDLEGGAAAEKDSEESVKTAKVYEQKIVVIMAGDDRPTYLATPVSSSAAVDGGINGKAQNEGQDETGSSEKMEKAEESATTVTENRVTQQSPEGQDRNQ